VETSAVTGKFGLGFKSIFLITDRPHVLSHDLGFEVVGALLPRRLALEDRQRLAECYKGVTGCDIRDTQGTIFFQPLRPESRLETILRRFRRLLPVQLAFTQRVRRCHLHGLFPEQKTTEWSEKELPHADGWVVGLLDSPDPESLVNRRPTAVLRLGEKKALLLGLDPLGFTPLPDEMPSIWVTAPTGHCEKVGGAINAPFALDVGRAQLFRDGNAHHDLADELGVAVGAGLLRLFDAVTDHWEEIRSALHLRDDAKPADVWQSLWLVFGERLANRSRQSDSEAFQLLHRIFWGGATHGLAHLYEQRCAMPTGLDVGGHAVLTKRALIAKRLTGCLDEEEGRRMFERVAAWPQAETRLAPGAVVSGSQVWAALKQLRAVDERQASPVDLSHLIGWELEEDPVVLPDRAELFGTVIRPDLLHRLESTSLGLLEARDVRETLKSVRFRSRKGTDEPAERLLVPTLTAVDKRDEMLRAAFAPDEHLLADAYSGDALSFFLACRGPMAAPREDMVEWALAAQSNDQRSAVLRYLQFGELRDRFSVQLRDRLASMPGNWLCQVESSPLFDELRKEQKIAVLLLLGRYRDRSPPGPTPPSPPDPPRVNTKRALTNVHKWWTANRTKYVAMYESWVYPRGWPDVRRDVNWSDTEQRKAWLTLFLLASCHTLGRVRFQQNRQFVQLCDNLLLLDGLANVAVHPADWLIRVEEYAEAKGQWVEYYHWIKQLLGVFLVARKLDHYGDAFLQAGKFTEPFSLDHIVSPNTSQYLDFTGPSLQRVLGMGACFLMRELLRKEVLRNSYCHPHCYVPHRRVRRLLEELGCPGLAGHEVDSDVYSRQIHEFLCEWLGAEKATFERCFDLPFLILAYARRRKHKLHRRLFDRELDLGPKPVERWVTGPYGPHTLYD
jgi:hypothetical protein